ncbi:MAG TPA: SAM-dependent methyltransferase [Saprospiraceae bacterium]|nr:SAM-dependent methyltransferase [Saprospiraceae bacterium]HMP23073.1 SAM-dependent methyltransferase [Saprospiraceae bacterium]
MSEIFLTPQYWNERYRTGHTPWDIGQVSPAIQRYLDQLPDQSIRILIPGAGNAYEAIYAHRRGFSQVYVCDWAPSAFDYLRQQAPDFPAEQLLIADFFKLDITVDLIIEQTFFCAIDPAQRAEYARKAADLLSSGGRVAGLLFATHFAQPGPPFGGTQEGYEAIFNPFFQILQMDITPWSIPPRAGNELFFELKKKPTD